MHHVRGSTWQATWTLKFACSPRRGGWCVRCGVRDARAASSHQGFPVVDEEGRLVGVVTRRDLLDARFTDDLRIAEIIRRPPAVAFTDSTLRDAADLMVVERVGRLPVVPRGDERRVVGIISRSDLLAAHAPRIAGTRHRGGAKPR